MEAFPHALLRKGGIVWDCRVAFTIIDSHPLFIHYWFFFRADADWTASGRPVETIELFMRREVLPLYGNTHTTTSTTGAQTTSFREESRRIIAEAVHAKVRTALPRISFGTFESGDQNTRVPRTHGDPNPCAFVSLDDLLRRMEVCGPTSILREFQPLRSHKSNVFHRWMTTRMTMWFYSWERVQRGRYRN